MRIALIFPPPASPTYVPLGVAALQGWITRYAPAAEVTTIDLNLSWYRHLVSQTGTAGANMLSFMHGTGGPFYDPATYRAQRAHLGLLDVKSRQFVDACRRCLEQPDTAPDRSPVPSWMVDACDNNYDMVGFSIMFSDQLYPALVLAEAIRARHPRSPSMILGGAAMSAIDTLALLRACTCIDGICEGEGETALALLAAGTPPGAIMQTRDRTMPSPLAPPAIGALPCPVFSQPLSTYFNPEPVVPVVSSRGCRWGRCRFCGHNASFDTYRARGAARFVDDLEQLCHHHAVRHFYWADQYIGADDLLVLARTVRERGLNIRFHVMARAEEQFTPAHFQELAAAGCRWISWGIESGSQRLLNVCRKGVSVATIERLLQWSAAASINNLAMMIFGLPTSTPEDLDATLRFFERTASWVDSWTASSFVLFDKTPFARQPQRYGLHPLGAVCALQRKGVFVASTRLLFRRDGESHGAPSTVGAQEVGIWQRFRAWTPSLLPFDELVSEHYLLWATQVHDTPPADPPLPIAAARGMIQEEPMHCSGSKAIFSTVMHGGPKIALKGCLLCNPTSAGFNGSIITKKRLNS